MTWHHPEIDPAAIEAEVNRIASMNKGELKALWRELCKSEPPQAFGPDLLRRSLAYKVQERACGGLSRVCGASSIVLYDRLASGRPQGLNFLGGLSQGRC